MTTKIPITDGIPRDPLDTELCDESLSESGSESLSKSKSSGSESLSKSKSSGSESLSKSESSGSEESLETEGQENSTS